MVHFEKKIIYIKVQLPIFERVVLRRPDQTQLDMLVHLA